LEIFNSNRNNITNVDGVSYRVLSQSGNGSYTVSKINGEIRGREKTMRGLKQKDTPILKGYQIYHNYIQEHEGLDGKTPAEACGIKIEGKNK
jgi:hypothetical protein